MRLNYEVKEARGGCRHMYCTDVGRGVKFFRLPIRRGGLSFIEIVIALSLFTIAIIGFLQAMNMALNVSYRVSNDIIATNLGRALMAEIMSKRFAEDDTAGTFGPEGEVGRSEFDDVDDYHPWSESPPVTIDNLIMDGDGTIPNYVGFTRSVEVKWLDENMVEEPAGGTDYKQVDVLVTIPSGKVFKITEVKTNLQSPN